MSLKQTIDPIKPKNNCKLKWKNIELGIIDEENSLSMTPVSLRNSMNFQDQFNKVSNNHSYQDIHGGNNRNTLSLLDMSPRINTTISNRNQIRTEVSPIKQKSRVNDTQTVVINNRKYIVSKSRSNSPVVKVRSISRPKIDQKLSCLTVKPLPHRFSQQHQSVNYSHQLKKPIYACNEQLMLMNWEQKQALLNKIQYLSKLFDELQRQKQQSVVTLLKENNNLRQKLQKYSIYERINNSRVSDSKVSENLSHNLIKLSEIGEIDNLKQINAQLNFEVEKLKKKISDLQNPFTAISQSPSKSLNNQQQQNPIVIPLPPQKQISQVSELSRIIKNNLILPINSIRSEYSRVSLFDEREQLDDQSCLLASNILRNLQSLTEENQMLKSETTKMNEELREKGSRINELENYMSTVNKYINQNKHYGDDQLGLSDSTSQQSNQKSMKEI